jgi:hypothetical protein
MQVAVPTPQTAGRLFAAVPDVAKFLAVVALRKGVLGFIRLYLDGNVPIKKDPSKDKYLLTFLTTSPT